MKRIVISMLFIIIPLCSFSQNTWDGGGAADNWSDPLNWNNDILPGAADNVTIASDVMVTIDGNFSCNNLSLIADGARAQITSSSNSLTINGTLTLTDAGGGGSNDVILDAGPGTITVAGTVSLGTTDQNTISVSTGMITFSALVTLLDDGDQDITFTGTGTINFNGGLTDNGNGVLTTLAGCTANFGGSYTNINNAMVWNASSNVVFNGGAPTITPTALITFGNFQINAGITVTLAGNIQLAGDWINNGGTLSGGANTVTFESIGNTIGGTAPTTFPNLKLGNTLNNVSIILNINTTCADLIFDADNSSRTLTHGGSNPSLTVTGSITMNQPTANNKTNLWDIAAGSASVNGNLVFAGTNNTISRITKINVSSGSFSLTGNITWMTGQGAPQEVATEVISVNTGTLTFASSLTMAQGDGTLNVTGPGTVNFNGAAAPSFALNGTVAGNTINSAFTTSFGSAINFATGFTNANAAVTLADGSTAVFTGSGTITPTAAIAFGNIQINATPTVTLAGNISLTNNWTNLGGTFTPGANTVTFSGTAAQTITKTSGETFYNLTTNTTGPLTLAATSDVMVTNTLTMTAGNYNLNGRTLTLGNSAAATLVRTAGIMYGGTFKRWFPTAAISSTIAPLYGLFPIGSSTDYRPVAINSTANPTTAGYVSASHTDALSVTDVSYVDNEGATILRISNIKSILSVGTLSGGTYNIDVSFTTLSATGVLTDLKLETYTGASMGSVGISAATAGTVSSPIVKRTGLTATELQNDWVVGTINVNPVTGTPIRQYYYSRKNGNWNDATIGNGTWSYTSGGAGASCDCVPVSDGYAVISIGQTVTVNVASTIDFAEISNAATLDGTANFSVNKDLTTAGSGKFTPTAGSWTIARNLIMTGTSSSSLSGASTVTGILNIGTGTILTMNGGVGLTVTGNLAVDGTLALSTSTMTLNGVSGTTIGGSAGAATITGAGATVNVTTANKTIPAGTNLIIAPVFSVTGAITVTNNGTVTLSGNLTGSVAGSTWTNAAGSTMNAAGAVLTTGALNASASPNTVHYNGPGAQTVKQPSANTYYNLTLSNAGTKTPGGALIVSNMLAIQNAAVFSDGSNAVTGTGGLTMSGTSEYQIGNNTNPVPSLSGTYNLTGGTIDFNRGGNQNVRSIGLTGPAPAAYYHVTFSNNGTKTLLGPITVQGNLSVSGTADLDVSGSNYGIDLYGNWNITSTNGDPFGQRSGTVSFIGSAAQNISNTGDAQGTEFYNVIINNTSATGVTLSGTASNHLIIRSGGALTLTDGYIYSSASNMVQINSGASSSGGSANSFVDGPVKKIGNSIFIFPTGDDKAPAGFGAEDVWARISISAPATATTEFTGQYFATAYTNTTSITAPLDNISSLEYWTLDRAVTTDQIRVTLYWENASSSGIDNCPDLTMAHWTGATWVEEIATASGSCTGTGTGSVTTNSVVTSYSPFTFGSKSTLFNPLPIELLSFQAKINNNKTDLNWTTATEINNDYFTIEKTKDGISFEMVVIVDGAGNSSTVLDYSAIDENPYEGISYYRLKQTDFDGKFTYSNLVAVENPERFSFNVFPNPVDHDNINMSIEGNPSDEVLVVIRDLFGREFYSKVFILNKGDVILVIDKLENLVPGVYNISASNSRKLYSRNIVIK